MHFLAAALVFGAIDALWLRSTRNFYKKEIGKLLKNKPNFVSAAVFYVIFILGLVVFVIEPSLDSGSVTKALILGALFGLVAYGTYDLTNHATIKNFPIKIVLIDLAWGAFLTATVSVVTFWIFG